MESIEHDRWMHRIEAALRALRKSGDIDSSPPPADPGDEEDEDAAAAHDRDG